MRGAISVIYCGINRVFAINAVIKTQAFVQLSILHSRVDTLNVVCRAQLLAQSTGVALVLINCRIGIALRVLDIDSVVLTYAHAGTTTCAKVVLVTYIHCAQHLIDRLCPHYSLWSVTRTTCYVFYT